MDRLSPQLASVLFFLATFPSLAQSESTTAADLIELEFEELVAMNVQVESAGKTSTRAMDLPYAAFVISSEDIRASGAQSIPDALRLAPGLIVGQISAGEWGVSIRGLGGRFSRFVLVMVDGRIAYNLAFSGVNWDELNIPLAGIERIEVIRGPNAAAWGANAVNGIINIITRGAGSGEAGRVHVWSGSQGRAGQSAALNFQAGSGWHWTLAEHTNSWNGLQSADGNFREAPHRDWRMSLAGARERERSKLRFKLETFGSEQSPEWSWVDDQLAIKRAMAIEESKTGWVGQIGYEKSFANGGEWKTRFSVDQTERENRLYNWHSLNYQLDTEFSAAWGKHQVSAGINSRYSESDIYSADFFTVRLDPASRDVGHYGVYLSDVYSASDNLQLSLAARADRSELSDTNIQPSARMLWAPSERDRFWLAWSEASSTPSRAVVDVDAVPYVLIPAMGETLPLPLILVLNGHTGGEQDVRLQATEIGYRKTFDRLGFDLTFFDFNYRDEVDVVPLGDPEIVFEDLFTPLYLRQEALFINSRNLDSEGAELSVRAQPTDTWSSQLAWSWLEIDKEGNNSSTTLGFLNSWNFHRDMSLNLNLRYAKGLDYTSSRYTAAFETVALEESYWVADLNLDWQVTEAFSVNFIANNLGDKHGEYAREEFTTRVMQTEPYALVKLRYSH